MLLNILKPVLEYPTYVYVREDGGYRCDKLYLESGVEKRKVYHISTGLLTAPGCTCLGFIKFKSCKHVRMWLGDFTWTRKDCSDSYVRSEVDWIIEEVGKDLPGCEEWWNLDVEEMPLYCFDVKLAVKGFDDVDKICYVKKFVGGFTLGVTFQTWSRK
jgi:hypothetical protein